MNYNWVSCLCLWAVPLPGLKFCYGVFSCTCLTFKLLALISLNWIKVFSFTFNTQPNILWICNRIILNTASKEFGPNEDRKPYICLELEFWPLYNLDMSFSKILWAGICHYVIVIVFWTEPFLMHGSQIIFQRNKECYTCYSTRESQGQET